MKNFITVLFLTAGLFLNAQYYSITYIQVPVDKQAEVARLETQYWSKVAKANIDQLSNWRGVYLQELEVHLKHGLMLLLTSMKQ